MTPEEYAARQAVITAAVAAFAYQFAQFWTATVMGPAQWVRFLQFLWPEIQRRREESAALAREFYDYQRSGYHPALPRFDKPLEGNSFDVFVQNMEPVRKKMSQADSPQDAVTRLTLQVVREVENAGRRQIINSVKEDQAVAEAVEQQSGAAEGRRTIPFSEAELAVLRDIAGTEPKNLRYSQREIAEFGRNKLVRGWARVATGRETCGWCLMLISRGPVYLEANTAGLDLDDESAIEMFKESDLETYGEDTRKYMEDWHTGCDCKVIPVFKTDDWENSPLGRAADRALELWNEASQEAAREMEERGPRIHTVGKNKGQEMTFNEEAILALRRRLERGDINPSEYAGLAA